MIWGYKTPGLPSPKIQIKGFGGGFFGMTLATNPADDA